MGGERVREWVRKGLGSGWGKGQFSVNLERIDVITQGNHQSEWVWSCCCYYGDCYHDNCLCVAPV